MTDSERTELDESPKSNVISLEPRLKGTPSLLVLERTPLSSCRPHAFIIEEKTHGIRCRTCGSEFEPFQALLYLAQHWPDYNGHREMLRTEITEMREERARLKKEVENLRSNVRRLGGDPGKPKYWRRDQ